MAPAFINVHVKCPIFLAKDDEDSESHLLHSNDWMNLQHIAEDFKNAYHTIKLSESSKPYCGILPFIGSTSYAYQRIPKGLSTCRAIWQSYVNAILGRISDRLKYSAIMDDLLLHNSKYGHLKYLEDLLKAKYKNILKISPKKIKLFKTGLQYMGSTFFVKDKRAVSHH